MIKQMMTSVRIVWPTIVGSLVILGVIGGIWSLWDRWKNRKPRLELFVPQYSTGIDAKSERCGLFLLVRISNSSQKNAYILPETISVEIEKNGKWYKTPVAWIPKKEFLETDFSEHEKVIHGVEEVQLLKRFESPVISYDYPLTRYIVATHNNDSVLKTMDKIRIKIRDCHMKLYDMCVDFEEQQKKYDPDFQPKEP